MGREGGKGGLQAQHNLDRKCLFSSSFSFPANTTQPFPVSPVVFARTFWSTSNQRVNDQFTSAVGSSTILDRRKVGGIRGW